MAELAQRSTASIWMQAVRSFSFSASIVPVVFGAALASHVTGPVYWYLFPMILICSLLMQSATNLVNDYFDFQRGVDTKDTYGSSRVIVEDLLPAAQLLRVGIILFVVAFVLGLTMVAVRGTPVLWLGVIGILGGYFYSGGGALAYKYVALGDPLVFILMGPMMVCGSYYVLTGEMSNSIIYASLPVGCLVAAILVANNIRDIVHDKAAGTATVATVVGPGGAKMEYLILVSGAYIIVGVLVLLDQLSPWTLLVALSLPPALKNISTIMSSDPLQAPKDIAMTDVRTAQHHLLFGVLYSLGVVLSHWI